MEVPAAHDVILSVRDLVTTFDTDAGRLTAVDGVSFDVRRGRTFPGGLRTFDQFKAN